METFGVPRAWLIGSAVECQQEVERSSLLGAVHQMTNCCRARIRWTLAASLAASPVNFSSSLHSELNDPVLRLSVTSPTLALTGTGCLAAFWALRRVAKPEAMMRVQARNLELDFIAEPNRYRQFRIGCTDYAGSFSKSLKSLLKQSGQ